MKSSFFNARCDIEIGDKVKIKTTGEIFTVEDIRTIYYLKSGIVKFEFQLKNDAIIRWWSKRNEFIYPIE